MQIYQTDQIKKKKVEIPALRTQNRSGKDIFERVKQS